MTAQAENSITAISSCDYCEMPSSSHNYLDYSPCNLKKKKREKKGT